VAGPISTTGKAVFSEKIENDKAVCSYSCEIESRNVSQQPIVLSVVAEEFRCSNGLGAKHMSEHDYFFNRALLGSGKTITYPSHRCMSERMVGPVPSIARVPTAEATTVYVQFQNGTSFGAPGFRFAADALAFLFLHTTCRFRSSCRISSSWVQSQRISSANGIVLHASSPIGHATRPDEQCEQNHQERIGC
jgi:hypothetical protein